MMGEQPHPVTLGMHDETILRMKANNVSTKRIGIKFGCSGEVVMDRVKVLRETGVIPRRSPYRVTLISMGQRDNEIMRLRSAGRTLAEIGRAIGCCDRVISPRIAWLKEAGELPQRQAKVEATQPQKPVESIKRTPQLDALFTKAVMNDIPTAKLREIFKCDDPAIREWKRVLGLSSMYAEGKQS